MNTKTRRLRNLKQQIPRHNFLTIIAILFSCSVFTVFPSSIIAISQLTLKAFVAQILFIILLVYWCIQHWNQPVIRLVKVSPTQLLLYLLFALFLLSTMSWLWATNFDFFIYKWMLWMPAFITAIIILNESLDDINRTIKSIIIIFITASIAAVIGVLQYLTELSWIAQSSIPGSLFANKNMAAHIMVLTMPLGFYLLHHFQQQKQSNYCIAICMGLSAILGFIFYTTTRAAWVSMALQIGLIAIALLYFRIGINKKYLLIITTSTLLLVNLSNQGFTPFWQVSSQELSSIVDSASNKNAPRYKIWRNTLDMITHNPLLGTGLGSYFHNVNQDQNLMSTNTFQRVHNDYLEFTVELGFVGLAILTIFGVLLLLRISCFIRHKKKHPYQFLVAVLTICLTGFSINSLFSFPYQWVLPPILLAFYLGIIINILRHYSAPDQIYSITTYVPWRIAGVASIILALTTFWINTQWANQLWGIEKQHYFQKNIKGFYHPDAITTLRILGFRLYHQQQYAANVEVQKAILDYWPQNYLATEHLAVNLRDMGDKQASLETLKRLRQLVPPEYFKPDILELKMHLEAFDAKALLPVYNHINSSGRAWIAKHPIYFESMFLASLILNDTASVPMYYQKASNHLGKTVGIERNMAAFYLNNRQFEQAIPHIRQSILLDKNPKSRSQYIKQMKDIGIVISDAK